MSQIVWKKRNWTRMCNSVDGRWRIVESDGMFVLFSNKVQHLPPVYALVTAKSLAQAIVDQEERSQMSNPKLFHAVMEHATVTFTDHSALRDFMSEVQVGNLPYFVLCESEVTPEEYNRVCEWEGSVTSDATVPVAGTASAAATAPVVEKAIDAAYEGETALGDDDKEGTK